MMIPMRQKYIKILLFLISSLLFATNATALNPITVLLNQHRLVFDVEPVIENGTTLVPMRKIFESLGADVSFEDNTQTVVAIKDEKEIILQIGSKYPVINGEKTMIEVPAKIKNERTLVPLRFVSEALGANVDWDGATRTITIESAKKSGFNVIRFY